MNADDIYEEYLRAQLKPLTPPRTQGGSTYRHQPRVPPANVLTGPEAAVTDTQDSTPGDVQFRQWLDAQAGETGTGASPQMQPVVPPLAKPSDVEEGVDPAHGFGHVGLAIAARGQRHLEEMNRKIGELESIRGTQETPKNLGFASRGHKLRSDVELEQRWAKARAMLEEIGSGVEHGPYRAAEELLGTFGLGEFATWLTEVTGGPWEFSDPPSTAAGETAQVFSQFGTGVIPTVKGMQWLGIANNLLKWTMADFVTEFTFFGPDEPGAGELARDIGELDNEKLEAVRLVVQEYLEKDEDDSDFEKKFKNAAGWTAVGLGFDGLIAGVKGARILYKNPQLRDTVEKFIADESGTLGGRVAAADPFYSKALRYVEQSQQGKASGAQWRATMKTAGIKDEELAWLGLDGFLGGNKSITKADLTEYIRANQVEVRDVTKGGASDQTGTTKFSTYTLPGGENYRELLLTLPVRAPRAMSPGDVARLEELTNKRVADSLDGLLMSEQSEYLRLIQKRESFRGTNFTGGHYDEPNVLAHVRFNERQVGDQRVLFIEEIQSDWHAKGRKQGYIDPANVGKIEVFDPTTGRVVKAFDTNEQAISFILERPDEMLDYAPHGQGGVSGPGVPDAPFKKTWHELTFRRMVRYAAEKDFDRIAWITGKQTADRYDLSKYVDRIDVNDHVDGGRFVDVRSDERSLLDMRYGDDGVITESSDGDLVGKHLDKVIGKDMADKILNTPSKKIPDPITSLPDDLEVVLDRSQSVDQQWAIIPVDQTHGKPLYSRHPNKKDAISEAIVRANEKSQASSASALLTSFEGGDLAIGGEWAFNLYDKMLPNYARKFGKKFGAKVGKADISNVPTKQNAQGVWLSSSQASEAREFIASGTTVHFMDITDKMRDTAMKEGFPLFSIGAGAAGLGAGLAEKAERQGVTP